MSPYGSFAVLRAPSCRPSVGLASLAALRAAAPCRAGHGWALASILSSLLRRLARISARAPLVSASSAPFYHPDFLPPPPRPPRSASLRSRPPPSGAPLRVSICYIIIIFVKDFRSGNVKLSEKCHNYGKIANQLRHTSDTCPFEKRFVSLWTLFYVQPINLLKNHGKR